MAQPAATVAKIYLDRGETFICEVGAMIAMSTKITLQTTSRSRGKSGGGMLQGFEDCLVAKVSLSITLRLMRMVNILFWDLL